MVQTQRSIVQPKSPSISERIDALDWPAIIANLDDHGCATTEPLLTPKECAGLAESYGSDQLFRSRIVMARHGFGRGEYKYFAYPLPHVVAALRDSLYPALAQVANRWNKALDIDLTYPSTHAAYLRRCHADGQSKPTPLLLRYGAIPHMLGWGLEFARNCTPERFRENAKANLHLALHSLKSLQEIGAETGISYDRAERGVLKIYRSKESLDGAERSTAFLAS